MIAAERVGRMCYAMELDPLYVDTAVQRWQHFTGERAIHASSCRSFAVVARVIGERAKAIATDVPTTTRVVG